MKKIIVIAAIALCACTPTPPTQKAVNAQGAEAQKGAGVPGVVREALDSIEIKMKENQKR